MATSVTRSFVRRVARYFPRKSPPFWQGQLIALICVVSGASIRFLLEPIAHGAIPVVVFYPFILIASIWGGTYAGISTLVLADIVADYFWLPPIGRFGLNTSSAITLSAFSFASTFAIALAAVFRALIDVHIEGEERAALLAHETRHRALNMLGIVQAIAMQTARNASTVADFQSSFATRLGALARVQHLISDNPDVPPDLCELLERVIQPFGTERFLIEGPTVLIAPHLASSCALLFHELGTNATKYGALSVPEGRVALTWVREGSVVRLDWRELNGPPVVTPSRSGFGERLLKTAFPPTYGHAEISYHPQGVRCSIEFVL
jgi:two-component sensor histidine kinase